jgi:hypothetical protein
MGLYGRYLKKQEKNKPALRKYSYGSRTCAIEIA